VTLTGFTLFKVQSGWQLSTREGDDTAWSVRIISEEQAQTLLRTVEPITPVHDKPRNATDLFGRASPKRPRVHL